MRGKNVLVDKSATAVAGTKQYLSLRDPLFPCVYYNNGSGLPFFPIATSWGNLNRVGDRKKGASLPIAQDGKRRLPIAPMQRWQTSTLPSLPVLAFPRRPGFSYGNENLALHA